MDDPEPPDTRSLILDAAAGLFALKGQSATTIKEIGQRAGVNPALIYYYFADKAALYDAVIGELVGRFPERLAAAAVTSDSPRDALAAVVRMQAKVFLDEPRLPRLIVRELADHDGDRISPLLGEHARRLLATLTSLITSGQQSGIFRCDVTPEFAAVSCLSQLNWYCISSPLMQVLLGGNDSTHEPLAVAGFADHVVQFTLAGLEVR